MLAQGMLGANMLGAEAESGPPTVEPFSLAVAQIVVRAENGPVLMGATVTVYHASAEATEDLDDKLSTEDRADIYRVDGTYVDQRGEYEDEPVLLEADDAGRVMWMAPAGVYDIRFEAEGTVDWWRGYRLGLAGARDVGTEEEEVPATGDMGSLLNAAPDANDDTEPDWVLVYQGGELRRATISQLQTWINE